LAHRASIPAQLHQGLAHECSRSFLLVWVTGITVKSVGFFCDPALLLLCVQKLGIDRILFAVDYPFGANAPGPAWLARIPLCDEDTAKIASGKAKRLLRMLRGASGLIQCWQESS
jgi:hypothetical protein